ncbi:MAG: hypothetical protein IPM24_21965 [Bryobacterales bacterium]|nr:hypothetical protein [Bryobacterales bacterium]
MPGLAGIITGASAADAKAKLAKMIEAMCHESFYTSGSRIDETMGAFIGWTARRGSFGDGMPLVNRSGNVALMFSGEDYSSGGCASRRSTLVHGYEADAAAFPDTLDGIFHGVVMDGRSGRTILFNDRYGLHRLYYHEAEDGLYFAAEAKAILAVCPELRGVDARGLSEYVAFGCTLENRTLFRGINLVPPGSRWTFRNAVLEKKETYFDPTAWESQPALDGDTYYDQLRDVVARSLPSYLRGPEAAAVAITGGLDTRMIMAWSGASPGSLPCYTFGGELRDSRDVAIGRQVASLCGQTHHVIRVGEEYLSRFPHYSERTVYLTDGAVGVGNSPDLYVSEQARRIAPAKIVGTWGSELLGQAVLFKPASAEPHLYDHDFCQRVHQAAHTYAAVRRGHPVTFAAFRQTPWFQYGIEALEQTQLTVRAPFLSGDFVRTVYRAPQRSEADVRMRLIHDGNPLLAGIPSDRGVSPGRIGPRGIAARLTEAVLFKAEYLLDMGMPQWFAPADRLLAPLGVERLFLGRHKFYHFRTWYRHRLQHHIREVLLDPGSTTRPYLRPGGLARIVEDHIAGLSNHTTTIHTALTLEYLHRHFG